MIGPALMEAAHVRPLVVVAAERQYGNVASQIGGSLVHVEYLPTSSRASEKAKATKVLVGADLVVQNGLGQDGWIEALEADAGIPAASILSMADVLARPPATVDPYLWFSPTAVVGFGRALASALARIEPSQAAAFETGFSHFSAGFATLWRTIAAARTKVGRRPAATIDLVASALLSVLGVVVETPATFEEAISQGQSPSAPDVASETRLLSLHKVALFVYDQTAPAPLRHSLLATAHAHGVITVGVRRDMGLADVTYQRWIGRIVSRILRGFIDRISSS